MAEIKKIVIKSNCKLYDDVTHNTKFVLKDNFISYKKGNVKWQQKSNLKQNQKKCWI